MKKTFLSPVDPVERTLEVSKPMLRVIMWHGLNRNATGKQEKAFNAKLFSITRADENGVELLFDGNLSDFIAAWDDKLMVLKDKDGSFYVAVTPFNSFGQR